MMNKVTRDENLAHCNMELGMELEMIDPGRWKSHMKWMQAR